MLNQPLKPGILDTKSETLKLNFKTGHCKIFNVKPFMKIQKLETWNIKSGNWKNKMLTLRLDTGK